MNTHGTLQLVRDCGV